MLKSKITRTIAFLLSCIIVSCIAYRVAAIIDESTEQLDGQNYSEIINCTYNEENEIAVKLWLISAMYLRNLDEKGNFKGSDELKAQTFEVLKAHGCMNEKNELEIKDANGYEFYAAFGNNNFSNTDKEYNDIKSGSYSIGSLNDDTFFTLSYTSSNDVNWFETNYGMTYYYIDGSGVALFDFDTTGLDSYVDELGATIYYKKDGTTPFPYEYLDHESVDGEYVYEGESVYNAINDIQGVFVMKPTEAASEKVTAPTESRMTEDEFLSYGHSSDEYEYYRETYDYSDNDIEYDDYRPENPNGLYYYDREQGGFFKVVQNDFTKTKGDNTKIRVAVKPPDSTIELYKKYHEAMVDYESRSAKSIIELIPFGIAAIVLALYFIVMGGYNTKEKKFKLAFFDKLIAELPLLVAVGAVVAGFIFGDSIIYWDVHDGIVKLYSQDAFEISFAIYYGVIFGILVLMLNTLVIRFKCRSFMKTSLIGMIVITVFGWLKKLKNAVASGIINRSTIKNDHFLKRFFSRIILMIIAEIFLMIICFGMNAVELLFVCTIIMIALYIWLNMSDMKALTRLNEHIADIAGGNYTDHSEKPDSAIFAATQRLNNISAGLQNAVEKRISSERMKIDLVTNVSHDLKTPLTSIISYIDLLSKEELTPAAKDYVTIVENKANRLKMMVADLFDLAKATSRTDVSLEQIDAVVLTGQVLGDLADKIEASGKIIKTDIQAESAPITADGKRMYRVFQNLIDNALKYSLDGTRIYLTLKKENGRCIISVKNIASYEMTFTPEEILERFARGDESRSTEGNGLGLSIAKSFTEACGGEFNIDIDGDLFTASISFESGINN